MVKPGIDVEFSSLPKEIPIFPLTGALLLPGGQLPLNIFEPRYLQMVDAALCAGRWFGLVQPCQANTETVSDIHPLFNTGCLGRITTFSETGDGRYLLSILGVCRFKIKVELSQPHGFRRIIPNYSEFSSDFGSNQLEVGEREALSNALRRYFKKDGYEVDWESMEKTSDEMFVTSVAMACSLKPAEKQALLEAPDLSARTACLIAILEIANYDIGTQPGSIHH